jgi:hypothetical protein
MLRLWREMPEGPCRASLQTAEGEERLVFPDLDALFDYLKQVEQPTPPSSIPPTSEKRQ